MTRPDQTRPDHYSVFYSDSFYEDNARDHNYVSSQKVIAVVKEYLNFDSVIDVGCGVGQMLRVCSDAGAKVTRGVDGSWVNLNLLMIPKEHFTQADISQLNLKAKIPEQNFDLTISSEVAEHIDAKDSETFMDNLTAFSNVILFSAAIPGQGGTHHVNEQWPSYWIEKFHARGFVPIDCIRPKIWDNKNIRTDYRQNLLLFVKQESLKNYPLLEAQAGRPVLDIVHPEYWAIYTKFSSMGFKRIAKYAFLGTIFLIPAFFKALQRRLTSARDKM